MSSMFEEREPQKCGNNRKHIILSLVLSCVNSSLMISNITAGPRMFFRVITISQRPEKELSMEKYESCGIRLGFPKENSFRRCRIYYTRKMVVVLIFIAIFIHDICYTRIGAVNTGGSGTNQDTHGKTSLESGGSDIIWNDDLLQSLVFIWMESDPTTEGHAERMFQMWSSNPSKYPAITKEKLYEIARQFIEKEKNPLEPAELQKIRRGPLKLQKYQKWPPEFRTDVEKFLAKIPKGKLNLERPLRDLFFEQHSKYADQDRRGVASYIHRIRHNKRKTFGGPQEESHPRVSYDRSSQASTSQHFDAGSSQIPQRDPHPQEYSNPQHSKPSYVAHAHSAMFDPMSQFPQSHQIHHLPDRLYHGEGSSWTAHPHVEQSATQRLSHTSDKHEGKRRSRTRSESGSSSSREDNDSLDLDLHL